MKQNNINHEIEQHIIIITDTEDEHENETDTEASTIT